MNLNSTFWACKCVFSRFHIERAIPKRNKHNPRLAVLPSEFSTIFSKLSSPFSWTFYSAPFSNKKLCSKQGTEIWVPTKTILESLYTAFRFGALKSYFHHRSSLSTAACRGCCQSELGLDSLWELWSYRSTQRSKSCFKGWWRSGSWFLMSHGGEGLKEFVTHWSHFVEVWVLG